MYYSRPCKLLQPIYYPYLQCIFLSTPHVIIQWDIMACILVHKQMSMRSIWRSCLHVWYFEIGTVACVILSLLLFFISIIDPLLIIWITAAVSWLWKKLQRMDTCISLLKRSWHQRTHHKLQGDSYHCDIYDIPIKLILHPENNFQ